MSKIKEGCFYKAKNVIIHQSFLTIELSPNRGEKDTISLFFLHLFAGAARRGGLIESFPLWKRLFAGTVPANKNLFAGTVPAN